MLLISKQGGISRDVERFLFFSHSVRLLVPVPVCDLQPARHDNKRGHATSSRMFLLLMTERYYDGALSSASARRLQHGLQPCCRSLTMLLYIPQVYQRAG